MILLFTNPFLQFRTRTRDIRLRAQPQVASQWRRWKGALQHLRRSKGPNVLRLRFPDKNGISTTVNESTVISDKYAMELPIRRKLVSFTFVSANLWFCESQFLSKILSRTLALAFWMHKGGAQSSAIIVMENFSRKDFALRRQQRCHGES